MAVPDSQPEIISKKKIKVIKKVLPPDEQSPEEATLKEPMPRADIDELENLVACDQTTTTFQEEGPQSVVIDQPEEIQADFAEDPNPAEGKKKKKKKKKKVAEADTDEFIRNAQEVEDQERQLREIEEKQRELQEQEEALRRQENDQRMRMQMELERQEKEKEMIEQRLREKIR